jgi:hypothetical protein
MARDYEDVHDLDDLNDRELRAVVREHLEAHNALDIDDLTVEVKDGTVTLGGRVGTEGERLIAEHVVTDLVGVASVQNEILIDPIRRAESPEAIDEHLVDEDRRAGLQLGDRPTSLSPEVEERDPPIDADLYGTTDVRTAISDGTPWNPPEGPTQEGNAEGT